jgi:hypothetical protein
VSHSSAVYGDSCTCSCRHHPPICSQSLAHAKAMSPAVWPADGAAGNFAFRGEEGEEAWGTAGQGAPARCRQSLQTGSPRRPRRAPGPGSAARAPRTRVSHTAALACSRLTQSARHRALCCSVFAGCSPAGSCSARFGGAEPGKPGPAARQHLAAPLTTAACTA